MDPAWGEWSEWVWDETRAQYWRARQDTQGNLDYDFRAPRGEADDLADSFNNINLGGHQESSSYTQEGSYTYGASTTAGSAEAPRAYGASSVPASSYPSTKGQGKSRAQRDGYKDKNPKKHRSKSTKTSNDEYHSGYGTGEPGPVYQNAGDPSNSPQASSAAYSTQQPLADSTYGSASQSSAYASSAAEDPASDPRGSEYYSTGSGTTPSDVHEDPLQNVLSQANLYLTGDVGPSYSGKASSSAMAAVQSYSYPAVEDDGGRETPRPYGQQLALQAVPEGYSYQSTVAGTPYQTSSAETSYQTSPAESISLSPDDEYTVEPSSRFKPGEVFKIMWFEPLGAGAPRSEVMTQERRVEQDGRLYYQGFRRFIVVANDEGNCTCVPILTYERQACNKRGVKPHKHGIVYQAGRSPRMLPREPELGFRPVKVQLYERTEQLVKESRVNYAKLQTIEHNFRVCFIGSVDPHDFQRIVIPAVDTCWERKRRHNNY